MKTTVLKKVKQFTLLLVLLIGTQACVVTSIHPLYSDDVKAHLEGLAGTWGGGDDQIIITPVHDLQFKVKGLDGTCLFSTKDNPEIKIVDKNGTEKTMLLKDYKGATPYKDWSYHITIISKEKNPFDKTHTIDTSLLDGKIKTEQPKDTTKFIGKLLKLEDQYYLDVVLDDDFLEKKIPNISMQAALLRVHLFCKVNLTDDKLNLVFLEEDNLNRFIKKSNVKLNFIKTKGRFILTSETKELQKFVAKYGDKMLFDKQNNEDDGFIRLK